MFRNLGKFVQNWWHETDKIVLLCTFFLMFIGTVLVTAASPAIAARIGINHNALVVKHFISIALGAVSIIAISNMSAHRIKRVAAAGFVLFAILMVLTIFFGTTIKGAKRWISVFGISIQPAEFIKPCFLIVSGWILSLRLSYPGIPAEKISAILYGAIAVLLLLQPDIGTLILISISWSAQLFVFGISWRIISLIVASGGLALFGAYFAFPHVAYRINSFLDSNVISYQVSKSILAYKKGGLAGVGLAEGVVKSSLPDSHTDFIFAVAGEELGGLFCVVVAMLFCVIAIRVFYLMSKCQDYYVLLSCIGLTTNFVSQSMINIAVSLNLIPTKGMTLPLISYGGSSMIASCITLGAVLSFMSSARQKTVQNYA